MYVCVFLLFWGKIGSFLPCLITASVMETFCNIHLPILSCEVGGEIANGEIGVPGSVPRVLDVGLVSSTTKKEPSKIAGTFSKYHKYHHKSWLKKKWKHVLVIFFIGKSNLHVDGSSRQL